MRAFLWSMLVAFAVYFTAPDAHAQGGHCLNRPMVALVSPLLSRDLTYETKTPAKDATWMVSRVERVAPRYVVAERSAPRQSRAPLLCIDPHDPSCQIEVPDASRHHPSGAHAVDFARAADPFLGIDPADGTACADTPYTSGPHAGYASEAWRPPSV